MPKLKLGFLASHGGSNMQAIIDAINNGTLNAEPCVVISNNSESYALQRAKIEGIPHYHISQKKFPVQEAFDAELIATLKKHEVDIVVLAGYMKKISDTVIEAFRGKVLNIHPALLPKFGGAGMYGKFVHQAVIAAAEKESGPTVHVVDNHYDHGRILAQIKVPVLPNDTPESLAERVLEQEHIIYPQTLQRIAIGEIVL